MFRLIFIILIFAAPIVAQKTAPVVAPTPNPLTKAEIKTDVVFKDLPQTIPGKRRATTDAQDARLKGKVKSVMHRYFDGANQRAYTMERHYNERGDLVRELFYDVKGNLSSIKYFGFIDGKRVSLKVFPGDKDDKDQEIPAAGYDTEYWYAYGDDGQLSERNVKDDRSHGLTGIAYFKRSVLEVYSNPNQNFFSSTSTVINDKDDPATKTYQEMDPASGDVSTTPRLTTVYKYRYGKYDAKGNWLNVAIDETTTNARAVKTYGKRYETREITYY